MNYRIFRPGVAVVACLSFVVLNAWPNDDSVRVQKLKSVNIGLVQPLSGALSGYGEESQAGFKFVFDQVNAAGGIKSLGGAKINMIIADDGSSPGKAATEGRRLMAQEKVVMVVGSLLTSEMSAISPIADQFKIPVLSIFSGGTNSKYLYTLGFAYDNGYAANYAKFIDYLNHDFGANIKTAVLASSNYEAGQAVDRASAKRLPDIGVKVIGTVPLDQRAVDLNAAVIKMDALKPDVVTSLVTAKDGITLNRARAAMDSKLLFVGGTAGFSDSSVWHNLGDAIARTSLGRNTFGFTGYSPNPKQKHLIEFLAKAKASDLGLPISQNFVQGAQGARIVVRALENAGSTDSSAVLKALSQVNIGPDDVDLYLAKEGGLKFDAQRFLADQNGLFIQWNADGSQDVVWPPKFATRKPVLEK